MILNSIIKKCINIKKQIKCPNCGNILTVYGPPNKKIIVTCPSCHTKGYFVMPKGISINEKIRNLLISCILIIPSLLVSHFVFANNDLSIFLSFLILVPIFTLFHYKGEIMILFSLILLLLSIIILSIDKNEIGANQLLVYVYWLLVMGVICQLIEYLKDSKIFQLKQLFS